MKPHLLRKTMLAAALLSLGFATLPLAVQAAPAADNPASSAKSGTSAMTGEKTLSSAEKKFIEKASQGGTAEVQMGKLASEKAQSPDVKQFGERMVKDHTAANKKLSQLASQKGVTAENDMDSSSKREYDKLSKLSGAKFA